MLTISIISMAVSESTAGSFEVALFPLSNPDLFTGMSLSIPALISNLKQGS